jgi:hypothetical protein
LGGLENTKERLQQTRGRTRVTMQGTYLPVEEKVEVEEEEEEEDKVRLLL